MNTALEHKLRLIISKNKQAVSRLRDSIYDSELELENLDSMSDDELEDYRIEGNKDYHEQVEFLEGLKWALLIVK